MYVFDHWCDVFRPISWIIFGVVVIGLIALFALLVVYLLKWAEGKSPRKGQGSEKALEILKERLARGEITEEEYERLKKKIEE